MFTRKIAFAALTAVPFFLLFAVSAGLSLCSQRVDAEEPGKSEVKGTKQKKLLEERLAIVREIAKLSTKAYESGTGSYGEVREATRMLLQAELQLCDSDKDRIAVLEKFVAEAKKLEENAAQLSKAGQAPATTALKAKADRLQAEIALEHAKTKGEGPTSVELQDQLALAEKQVAIKRAGVKVADAQKKIAVARLASVKAQLAEAQAAESYAEKQIKRFEDLVRQQAGSTELVDERRTQRDAAKARLTAAEGKVAECEAAVLLEQSRVEQAQLEAEETELRLKQLKVKPAQKH